MKKWFSIFAVLLLTVALYPSMYRADAKNDEKQKIELWNAVKPLETTVVFLNTGAHPDDERSDFLAYLSRGLGVKTSSLIANRGEGGQNEIGQELDNALGIIRTREMIEAAKVTGVKAYHLSETTDDPIYDFGFSKTPEETLEKWGESVVYERFIRFIRTYQPDIVMPSFRDVDTQHGHHRTMTILSLRAFEDAADPAVFPEQLESGLQPWQVKKLYLPAETEVQTSTAIEIGHIDPIYQQSYPQIGEQSRYLHKSQGMGKDIPVEPRTVNLELVESIYSEKADDELFKGVPYHFGEWANILPHEEQELAASLKALQSSLEKAVHAYPHHDQVLKTVHEALVALKTAQLQTEGSKLEEAIKNELLHKMMIKEEQLNIASLAASQLEVKTNVETPALTRGGETVVTVTVKNNGNAALEHLSVELDAPANWDVKGEKDEGLLETGQERNWEFNVKVPNDASYSHAYDAPLIQAKLSYQFEKTTAQHRFIPTETVAVLPALSLTVNPDNIVVNTIDVPDKIPVAVEVKNNQIGAAKASIQLQVPDGWTLAQEQIDVEFEKHREEKEVVFTVKPPADIKAGTFSIEAIAIVDDVVQKDTIQEISYDHIGTFYFAYPAKVNVVAFDLKIPKHLKIGYIDSGFDKVAESLELAGFDITSLTESDLTNDLSKYDTIIVGIRAYLSREDLLKNNEKLLEYVKDGGHVVMQYHKPADKWDTKKTAPYKLEIGNPSIRWRVTDEESAVEILQPEHPLFHYPNEITEADWSGWVQERGLYFPMDWDDNYETFVSIADPNEEPFTGGILLAKYGKGTYLYTNLVWYRQIQSQVPGGYRIFTNLISYGSHDS
ncbi:NEW3 domain-containing protein [Bacillus chungangensis]|uniref:LmbE family N-acetylglucosaminyl deacetylase n=1 Tax=Bacillus chungangensis TaxID=587633 RepID=A0ABT9WVP2_9BACI|nr:NEW3 domain-containing protein [Bacillus chungangensis]MDQ0177282.1 LmbE family N-acetylglucosaminyl deacetylase [Bacillus chungangensis]